MDARPQRPVRSLHIGGDENLAPQSKQTLHQRHKSTGTLSTMLGANGLKMGSKRAAFNDVSNVVKTVTAHDDLAIGGKKNVYDVVHKPTMLEDKPAGLLRPAQRPLTAAGLKSVLGNNTSVIPPAAVTKTSTNPIKPRVSISKRAVPAIYKDENSSTEEQVQLEQSAPSVAPVHQHLGPRHAKSQPQLKSQAPVLRRTQSKLVGPSVSMKQEETAPTASYIEVYDEQAVDAQVTDAAIEDYNSYAKLLEEEVTNIAEIETSEAAEQAAEQLQEENRVQYRHLPPLPLGSEPEEYWEEEEEELYDEQGYATGHSYRSRGDNNTTSGATTVLFPKVTSKITRELEVAKEITESSRSPVDVEDELWDTSMVAEYGDEIFAYMRELEIKMLPNAHYMDNQAEIQWSMRSVLMDWIVQVHHRFHLLPETLFLCVNYIDRFLSCKIVSLGKLQLVGATAIFVAAKYEEINCPSVAEIVFMVDNGYSVDEILKAERFMLGMLQFELGWPGPMSFLRRISKADDYDLETRTLAKYFLEVTIMDERFVGSPPSFTAAGAHCLARVMLKKGHWTPAHVYYSGYTWAQLKPLLLMIMDCCENPEKHHAAVYDKYADKKYKRAAIFVAAEMKNNFTLPPPPPSILRSSLPSTEEEYAPMTSEIEPYTRMVQIKG